MEFFNLEMNGGLVAKKTSAELFQAAQQAEANGKLRKAVRLYGRAAKRGYLEQH